LNIISDIASKALLSSNQYNQLGSVLTDKSVKLTEHDCYKSVTQNLHKKCFDLPVNLFDRS